MDAARVSRQSGTMYPLAPLPLERHAELMVVQKRELAEFFGYESRNKYVIEAGGAPIAYAAEQGKGLLGHFARQFLGHMRTFEVHVFDMGRNLLFRAVHPFRFWLQRLDVIAADGRPLGAIQQRFALFSKSFEVLDAGGNVVLSVSSPMWKPWTFSFQRQGAEAARVEKKWAGFLKEAFTDADRFRVSFPEASLGADARLLVLAAALFIDLQYFENKAEL
jgi:Scramblase